MTIVRVNEPIDCGEHRLIAGVDEAGRGPLAGPVVVAAVILPDAGHVALAGLDDSKRLTAQRREMLFAPIQRHALAWSIIEITAGEIDQLNILGATLLGMQRSVEALAPQATMALIDGNKLPQLPCPGQAIIKGDQRVRAISAASILAKVHRDRLMQDYHRRYPAYGFDGHKGYPTRQHLQQLETHGPCPIHRRSFAPVRRQLEFNL